jgi:hypothetical protein
MTNDPFPSDEGEFADDSANYADPRSHDEDGSQPSALDAGGFVSYEDIARELGPFDPPSDFDHGEEFEAEVPRPIPKRLKTGSYSQRRRTTVRTLLVFAVGCIVFAPMPFVVTISNYILPLGYLDWIGAGLLLIALLVYLNHFFSSGLFAYVKTGQPIVGRILVPAFQNAGNAELPMFRLAAGVEYQHPENDAQMFATCVTEEQWGAADAEKFSQDFERGEYVTLVAQSESVESTIKLYGYLGLDPDREYVLKNGRPIKGFSPSTALLISFAILAGLGVLMMGIHVVITSVPDGGAPWKFVAGAAAGLVAGLVLWFAGRRSSRSNEVEKFDAAEQEAEPTTEEATPAAQEAGSEKAGPIVCGLIGAFLGLFGLCLLNTTLDGSSPVYEDIEVINFWEVTHNGIIRTYDIEYRSPKGGTHKYHATVEDIDRLQGGSSVGIDSGVAVLARAAGRFGLPWTRGIYPIVWIDQSQVEQPSAVSATIQFAGEHEGEVVMLKLTPVVSIDEDEFNVPGERLAKMAEVRLPIMLPPNVQLVEQKAVPAPDKR